MKRFLRILAIFLLPVLLIYGLFALVLINSRELAPLDEVVDATVSGELVRYGSAYHENFCAYKSRVTARLSPKLLVLGTSRSMQLRSEFFTGASFYNAGGGVRNAREYLWFLQQLPEKSLPKLVVAVLDQNMFNELWAANSITDGLDTGDIARKKNLLARVGASYGDGKFSILDNLLPKAGVYGLAAAGRGSGFAKDGSYRYGAAALAGLSDPESAFSQTYRDIDFSAARFASGDTVSRQALGWTEDFLKFCAAHNIEVVGILPPFAPQVFEKMQSTGRYGYIDLLPDALQKLFASYGFACYDYTYLPDTQAAEYLDGYHGGDQVYAKMMQDLSGRESALSSYIDAERIKGLLAQPGDNPRLLPG